MRNDGGAAIPTGEYTIVCGEKTTVTVPFISLRDHFAAAALQGLLASPAWEKACVGQPVDEVPSVAAEAVYELADAMLAEREKP